MDTTKEYKEQHRQLTLEDIIRAVEEIEKYREEQERKTPVMQYFADNKELGRDVLKLLNEFAKCLKNPQYFYLMYGGKDCTIGGAPIGFVPQDKQFTCFCNPYLL